MATPKNTPSTARKPAASARNTQPAAPKTAPAKDNSIVSAAEEKERRRKIREAQTILKADRTWKKFLAQQEDELMRLRDEILPTVTETTRSTLRSGDSAAASANGQHTADAGSEAEYRDLTLNLLAKDRETLYEIDAALERIRLGTYGICEMSLELIPKGRLEVRPYCRLTVKCQEEYEKKHGTAARFRPQDSRLVGYAGVQNDVESTVSLDDDAE